MAIKVWFDLMKERFNMEFKQNTRLGNECIIHETVSLLPIGDKWSVVVLMRCVGSRFDSNNLASSVTIFDTEEDAKTRYDPYNF